VSIKDKRVGFLGAGNMGEAIIKGLLQTGLVPASAIAATDVRADRLQHATDLRSRGKVTVAPNLRAAADQRMRIDHGSFADVCSYVDEHGRHADHAATNVAAVANARTTRHDAHSVVGCQGANWIS